MSTRDPTSTLTVLLVDDGPFVWRVTAKMLKTLGVGEVYEALAIPSYT